MRRFALPVVLLFGAVIFPGCGGGGNLELAKKVNELENRIAVMEIKVSDFERFRLTHEFYPNLWAQLAIDDSGYTTIVNEKGWFPVKINKVEKYLDGNRISLSIGNPSNAVFHGFQLFLKYGKGLNTIRTFTFSEPLIPGRYTRVNLVVTPSSMDDIRQVSLSLGLKDLAMGNR